MRVLLLTISLATILSTTAITSAVAETPKGTIVMAKQIDDIVSLDPAEAFEPSGLEALANIYDKLVTFDVKDVSKLNGALAESWTVSDDGKTFTFKLRPGVRFHSGLGK